MVQYFSSPFYIFFLSFGVTFITIPLLPRVCFVLFGPAALCGSVVNSFDSVYLRVSISWFTFHISHEVFLLLSDFSCCIVVQEVFRNTRIICVGGILFQFGETKCLPLRVRKFVSRVRCICNSHIF